MDEKISPEQMQKMVKLAGMIVDRICFEITASDDPDERIAQVQGVAATIAESVFNAEFGSTFCSLTQVGKRGTRKRVDNANKIAWFFVEGAIDVIRRMTPQAITAAAERAAQLN